MRGSKGVAQQGQPPAARGADGGLCEVVAWDSDQGALGKPSEPIWAVPRPNVRKFEKIVLILFAFPRLQVETC